MMKLKIIFCLVTCLSTYSWGQQNCPHIFTIGCQFNGVTYSEGEQLPDVCFVLKCEFNTSTLLFEWRTSNDVDRSCAGCDALDDPHLSTFDGHHYDWHGTCNYSMAQNFICPGSYNPNYGIFGDFVSCGLASCVDITTYKVSQNTVATIYHSNPPSLEVNGHPVSLTTTPQLVCGLPLPSDFHPLLAWKVTSYWQWNYLYVLDCVVLQGIDFSIRACDNSLYINTTVQHKNLLHGLCGYYSGIPIDDYMTRDCTILPLSTPTIHPFATSWLTSQQNNKECLQNHQIQADITLLLLVEECPDDKKKIYTKLCEDAIEGFPQNSTRARLIADCVNDCCRNPDDCEKIWIKNEQNLAVQALEFRLEAGPAPDIIRVPIKEIIG